MRLFLVTIFPFVVLLGLDGWAFYEFREEIGWYPFVIGALIIVIGLAYMGRKYLLAMAALEVEVAKEAGYPEAHQRIGVYAKRIGRFWRFVTRKDLERMREAWFRKYRQRVAESNRKGAPS